jgi:transcriptional regulator with XRE-family HTH domain
VSSFKEFLHEQLQDPEFAEAYGQVDQEMDFGLALAQRREELGMTQQALAALTGIKQPMIARIEGGQMPTAPTLQRLAIGLKAGILFTGSGVLLLPVAGSVKRSGSGISDAESYESVSDIQFTYRKRTAERYVPREEEYVHK